MAAAPLTSNRAHEDPLREFQLVPPPQADRLPGMLFLAALIHGVLIIGVAFNPALTDEFADAISLEVTIVADTDQQIDRPDQAEYLAQASQEGGGNTTGQVRPSAPMENASPIDNIGRLEGDSLRESAANELSADELLASTREQAVTLPENPRSKPNPDEAIAMTLEKGSDLTLPLPQEEHANLLIHDDDPRQLVISADTRESTIAHYLDNWKRRVETAGDRYFPEFGSLNGVTGSPTLEVSIAASGELTHVIIRKSSGSKILDQAALDILRRAAPFDPFPSEIRSEYDSLRFAYKWLFAEDRIPQTASVH